MISLESLQFPLLLAVFLSVTVNIVLPERDPPAPSEAAPVLTLADVVAAAAPARAEAAPRRFDPPVLRVDEGLGGQLALMGSAELEPVSPAVRNPGSTACLRCI